MRVVYIVLVNIFVHVTAEVKPKSVNLALETVLRFDNKNQEADIEVIGKVQKFLDTIKNVMTNYSGGRRHSKQKLKLTDFIRESARILKTYNDEDLEDVFAVIHEELRKYHYKGCKFYELVQNNGVRRFMSKKLEQVKATPASTLRKYLDKVVTTIDKDKFKGRDRFLVNLLNSLYSGTSDVFRGTINGLKAYRATGSGSALSDFVAGVLRTLLFDHYSNLNDNARLQVKHVVQQYWTNSNGTSDQRVEDNKMKHQRFKFIDVTFSNQDMRQWSEVHNQKATPAKKRELSENVFKVTGVTLKTQTVSKSTGRSLIMNKHKKKNKRTKNRDKENEGHEKLNIDLSSQSISAEYALFLKPKEVEKQKSNKDHPKKQSNKKYESVTRPKDISDDFDNNSFEMTIKNIKHKNQYKVKSKVSTKNGRDSELSKSIENVPKDESKENKSKFTKGVTVPKRDITNYYGHTIRSDEAFISDGSLSLGGTKGDPLSIEHEPSIGNRIKENVEYDPNSIGLLTGGQNIENMNYRSKKLKRMREKLRNPNKIHAKKVQDSAKLEEILAEHNAVIDVKLPIRNWNYIHPETSSVKTEVEPLRVFFKHVQPQQHLRQHKSKKRNRKPKKINVDTTGDIETRKSFVAVNKHASNEGMTIESFEKKEVNRITSKKHYNDQYKKEAGNETSVKMESLLSKLELQIKSVQKQIDLLQGTRISQTTTEKLLSNSNPSFRAAAMSAEETISADTSINSKSTTITVEPVKITTELDMPTNATVSTTMATSLEIESVSPIRTTTTTTTSTSESAPVFRSQDDVDTSSNNDAAIEESVNTTEGTSSTTVREVTTNIHVKRVERTRTTTDNPFKITVSVDPKEAEAVNSSTTEDSKLSFNKITEDNPSLNKLKDLPLYSENEINATEQTSSKVTKTETTTTNYLLNQLKKRVQSHKPDFNEENQNDLTLRNTTSQTVPQNSMEKINTTGLDEEKNDWVHMSKEFEPLGNVEATGDPRSGLTDSALKSINDT